MAGGTPHRPRFAAAAVLLAASVLLSRLLGYVREAVLAYRVGAGLEADAYYAGFQIPDLLNYFLAGGALSIAFIPLYTRARERSLEEAQRLYSTVLGTLAAVAVVATALLWWQAEALVALQFPRFDEEARALTVHLTRIVIPAQVFFVAGGIVRAVLMAEGRFAAQAAAPVLYNGAIIAGGLFLAPSLGVEGFAWGVLAGAILGPFVVPLLDARGRVPLRLRVAPLDRAFLGYLVLALPLMFGLSLLTVDEWYERWFGALLDRGTVAHLGYARRLMLVPVAIVGQAAATAALPIFARLWSEGRRLELDALLLRALRVGAALALFCAAGLFAFAEPLVRVVYQRGRFAAGDSEAVASILAVLALAAPAWVVQQIAARAFFARGDTWRPMLLGTAVALGMIPLYLELGHRFGAVGIAAAGAGGITLNAVLTVLLARRLHGAPAIGPLLGTLGRAALVATPPTWLASQIQLGRDGTSGALLDLAIGGAIFVALVGLGVALLGDPPMRDGMRRVASWLPRPRRAP
jgi:putative peptidoglycan lipid II flippase